MPVNGGRSFSRSRRRACQFFQPRVGIHHLKQGGRPGASDPEKQAATAVGPRCARRARCLHVSEHDHIAWRTASWHHDPTPHGSTPAPLPPNLYGSGGGNCPAWIGKQGCRNSRRVQLPVTPKTSHAEPHPSNLASCPLHARVEGFQITSAGSRRGVFLGRGRWVRRRRRGRRRCALERQRRAHGGQGGSARAGVP